MNLEFRYHYNYQRPNQAKSCGNQPPRRAFAQLPALAQMPPVVDPDAWLHFIDQQLFKRRVSATGVVKVDKQAYYIGRAHRGRYVVLKVDAQNKQFIVELADQVIKTVPIKGLYHGQMSLGDYLKFIQAQAVSEWRRYKKHARRYVRVTM